MTYPSAMEIAGISFVLNCRFPLIAQEENPDYELLFKPTFEVADVLAEFVSS